MTSKRQQTMAKMERERTVRERRARKLEKKQAAAAERKAAAAGVTHRAGEEDGLPEPRPEESRVAPAGPHAQNPA